MSAGGSSSSISTRAAPGLLVRAARWVRQLNRRRLARRKARKQRATDRAWLESVEPLRPANAQAMAARAQALHDAPLLSIVMLPDDDTTRLAPAHWPWHGAADSPWYDRWELLLTEPAHAPASDPRVRVVACDASHSAAQRFAAAVRAARGEAIVAVPRDAVLAPHATLLLAEAMHRFVDWRIAYSDHDSIGPLGNRHSPRMLCDWNLELLRSTPYLQGVVALRREHLLSQLDAAVAPSVFWRDLLLRMAETAAAATVIHIPHVLWHHWHRHREEPNVRPASAGAEELAVVQAHLQRCGLVATALAAPEGGVHVRYAAPQPPPLVSLIIPTRNGLTLLRQCMQSIFERTRYPNYEVVIVDNGSDDRATLAYLRELSGDRRVRVQRDDGPFNFSALNNAAVRLCRGEVLGLVNNDIEVIGNDWLDEMVGLALRRDVGAVGARLWFSNDTLQHAGVVLGIAGVAGHIHRKLPRGAPGYLGRAVLAQEFSAVTAACVLMRRAVYDEVGGLDEQNLAVDYNDIDLCLRIRQAGYRIVWTPHAQLYHHESATRGATQRAPEQQQRYEREVRLMQSRWGARLQHDPAFNPNLRLDGTTFDLAPSPRVDLATRWFDVVPAAPAARR